MLANATVPATNSSALVIIEADVSREPASLRSMASSLGVLRLDLPDPIRIGVTSELAALRGASHPANPSI